MPIKYKFPDSTHGNVDLVLGGFYSLHLKQLSYHPDGSGELHPQFKVVLR